MEKQLFDFALEIPQALASFGNWLVTPLDEKLLNISPLGLLGIGGASFVIAIIVVHIVRLFV